MDAATLTMAAATLAAILTMGAIISRRLKAVSTQVARVERDVQSLRELQRSA